MACQLHDVQPYDAESPQCNEPACNSRLMTCRGGLPSAGWTWPAATVEAGLAVPRPSARGLTASSYTGCAAAVIATSGAAASTALAGIEATGSGIAEQPGKQACCPMMGIITGAVLEAILGCSQQNADTGPGWLVGPVACLPAGTAHASVLAAPASIGKGS